MICYTINETGVANMTIRIQHDGDGMIRYEKMRGQP